MNTYQLRAALKGNDVDQQGHPGYDEIMQFGTYYHPAAEHYSYKACSVYCDRCQRGDLRSCIGYKDRDLCLGCAATLDSLICPCASTPILADNDDLTLM